MKFITGLLCLFSTLIIGGAAYANDKPAVAIMYSNPPEEILYLYDWIIVDPSTFDMKFHKERFYMKRHGKLIAYVSIGEDNGEGTFPAEIEKTCIIGKNKMWKSNIIDIRKAKCREFLYKKIESLSKDYDGFMLDTLDSYQIALPEKEWKSYEIAEANFINSLRKKFPSKLIIVNRPFSIFKNIKNSIDGVVVESLFHGLDKKHNYVKVQSKDSQWLIKKIEKIKNSQIPVIVVDYTDNKTVARQDADRIEKLGFIPWVTDKHLKGIGEGIYHFIPRKIAIIYDETIDNNPAHQMAQLPLEWLGFTPVLYKYKPRSLPHLDDSYRGILIWLMNGVKPENRKFLEKWLIKQIQRGKKIFLVDPYTLFDYHFLKRIGIEAYENRAPVTELKLLKAPGDFGFEIKGKPEPADILVKPFNGTPVVEYKNPAGQLFVPVALMKWGGYANQDTLIKTMQDFTFWVLNPFSLFRKVFGYIPAFDVTTENGRRIMTVHIDGDGFEGKSDFPPFKFSGEIIRDEIIKKYRVPHTASVIVGVITDLHPELSEKLKKIARSIFSLKNVEPASHSYSHPFNWYDTLRMSEGLPPKTNDLEYGHNLPIPGYRPSLKKEIIWSINYINNHLVPENKKVKVFLWTGDCVPPEKAIELTYKARVYNVNGGDTSATFNSPFLYLISPMGINKGKYFQVYAPVQNENIYTNLWKNFGGYVRVIQTFKLTEKPRRLKPISIYYHWYSGQKIASLKALKKVYEWALSRNPIPEYLSIYAQKVMEFRGGAMAKKGNRWVFKTAGDLRTVRIPASEGYPVINKSKGVVGYKKINNSIYISLDNSGSYEIKLAKHPENPFVLVESNGRITQFTREKGRYKISFKGYVPLEITVREEGCHVESSGNPEIFKEGNIIRFKFKEKTGSIEATCKD
ncbi:endo alpha-1,4 polygalactosaminidase [Desulfurobacterium sp.]